MDDLRPTTFFYGSKVESPGRHDYTVAVLDMSLYDGLEVETAPIPEISPQEDSSAQGNLSEKSKRHFCSPAIQIENVFVPAIHGW